MAIITEKDIAEICEVFRTGMYETVENEIINPVISTILKETSDWIGKDDEEFDYEGELERIRPLIKETVYAVMDKNNPRVENSENGLRRRNEKMKTIIFPDIKHAWQEIDNIDPKISKFLFELYLAFGADINGDCITIDTAIKRHNTFGFDLAKKKNT